MKSVLFVLTSADWLPFGKEAGMPTGFWAQEFLPALMAFEAAGLQCTVATLTGAPAALDAYCLSAEVHVTNPTQPGILRNQLAQRQEWQTPASLTSLIAAGQRFDAVFFPGGHGPLVDLAQAPLLSSLLADESMLVGAVCHGQAALLPALVQGRWRYHGYRMTCFSPADEQMAGVAGKVAHLLYDQLASAGGLMSHSATGCSHVVVDRNLHTGQNPQSMDRLIHSLIERLQ